MMITLEADTIFFGYGKFTHKIILDLLNKNQKILCVTNTHDTKISENIRGLNFITYQNAINYKIISNTSIFAWRVVPHFIENKEHLFEWLRSDSFQTGRSYLLSSASVYKDSPYPLTESSENLDAQVEKNDKYILEMILTDFMRSKKLLHTNLRISNVYGTNLQYGFISSLIKSLESNSTINLVTDFEIVRDYIFVEDVSRAIGELMKIDTTKDILNISTGIGTTTSQILEIFTDKGFSFENIQTITAEKSFKKSSILNCDELSHLIHWKPVTVYDALYPILKK